jgi:transcriptional regulator with XRE-family HTH domain
MNNTPKRINNPDSLERLGKRLRHQRELAGIAQSKVRGMRQATVSKIENGKDVTLDTLISYAASLGLEIAFVPVGQTQWSPPPLAGSDMGGALPPAGRDRPLDLLAEFSDLKDGE